MPLPPSFWAGPAPVGLSIGVAKGGEVIVAKGYGLADAEFDVPADKDTMFRIGSVTKQFTAAAIMRFVEQGKIRLDDDLGTYLPDFPLQGHAVTIRQLLNHTSGIPNYTSLGESWAKLQRWSCRTMRCSRHSQGQTVRFQARREVGVQQHRLLHDRHDHRRSERRQLRAHMQDAFFTPMGLNRTRLTRIAIS